MPAIPKDPVGFRLSATPQILVNLVTEGKWVRVTRILVSNNSSTSPGSLTLKLVHGNAIHKLAEDILIPAKGTIGLNSLPSLFDIHFTYNATSSRLTAEGSSNLYITALYFEDDIIL